LADYWLPQQAARLDDSTDPTAGRRQLQYLTAAERLVPGDARLQVELARAHARLLADQRERIEDGARAVEAAQVLLVLSPVGANPAWAVPPYWALDPAGWEGLVNNAERRLTRDRVAVVLGHLLQARDVCPLWAEAQLQLAENRGRLEGGDPAAAYLDRATFLAPENAEVFYRCGIQELAGGQPDQAWRSWRHCLELSGLYLSAILDRSSDVLTPQEILDRVLPDRPEVLAEAADYLFPQRHAAQRRPFLEKALKALRRQGAPQSAEDVHLEGILYRSLGRLDEALDDLEAAVRLRPGRADWRCELAELLAQKRRFADAHRQLEIVLEQQPDNLRARRLLDGISRDKNKE
jgi:tetratricopeptide (TPR) repeat protein